MALGSEEGGGRLEELFVAARAGDTGLVSTLLDNGFYVDCTDRVRAYRAACGLALAARRTLCMRLRRCSAAAAARRSPARAHAAWQRCRAGADARPCRWGGREGGQRCIMQRSRATFLSHACCSSARRRPTRVRWCGLRGGAAPRRRACPTRALGCAAAPWLRAAATLTAIRATHACRLPTAPRTAARPSHSPPARTCATCCAATTQARARAPRRRCVAACAAARPPQQPRLRGFLPLPAAVRAAAHSRARVRRTRGGLDVP